MYKEDNMKRKILTSIIALSIISSLFININKIDASAADTVSKTKVVNVGKYTGKKPWTSTSNWEPFSTQYGSFPTTYAYDDGAYKGTLTASRIRIEAANKKDEVVSGRTATVSSSVSKTVGFLAEPSFDNSISVSVTDSVTGRTVSGNIPKSGALSSPSMSSREYPYISDGRANNYDVNNNRYYGVLGNDSTTLYLLGGGSMPWNSASFPGNAEYYPDAKFYGIISTATHFTYELAMDMAYFSKVTGLQVKGVNWAEGDRVAATTFKNVSIGWDTDNPNNVGKKGSDLLAGGTKFRTEGTIDYTANKTLTQYYGEGIYYGSNGSIPLGTIIEVTYFNADKSWAFVRNAATGVNGWVQASGLTLRNAGTKNLREYRRGAYVPYRMWNTEYTYKQNYSGPIALPDYVSGQYCDDWNVYVEYVGDVIDYRLNNFKSSNLKSTPASTTIFPGKTSAVQDLAIDFTITHEMVGTLGTTAYNPNVVLKLGSTQIWTGNVSIMPGQSVNKSINVTGVTVPLGNNTLSIEVNKDRTYVERNPSVSDPYLDNIDTEAHNGRLIDAYNFTVPNVSASPINAMIEADQPSVTQSMTVNFTIAHAQSVTSGTGQLNPMVHIKLGGTLVWSGNVGVAPGSSTNKSVKIDNVIIPPGNHILSVEVNPDKKIIEQLVGFDPYADNIRTITYPGVRYLGCDLPGASRNVNTWSEKWTRIKENGTLSGAAGNQIYNLSAPTITTQTINYRESYEITEVYYRSKWSKDMHEAGYLGYNQLPARGIGWVKIVDNSKVKIKAGYAFEVVAVTKYNTDRYVQTYNSTNGTAYNGPNGPGVHGETSVTPMVTPIDTPNVMYINMGLGASGGNVCRIMTTTDKSGAWYDSSKTFELPLAATINGVIERKLYTNVGGKSDTYTVTISTPRPDKPNAFKGYEAEKPVNTLNKGYLHDSITFQLEVLGQDDIKSHIVQ